MPIEAGKPGPLFTLKDAAGKSVSLKNFRGQHVIVYFYPKDDTPGCAKKPADSVIVGTNFSDAMWSYLVPIRITRQHETR
jgi:hypothetical protein